jgi:hypothetical protein
MVVELLSGELTSGSINWREQQSYLDTHALFWNLTKRLFPLVTFRATNFIEIVCMLCSWPADRSCSWRSLYPYLADVVGV